MTYSKSLLAQVTTLLLVVALGSCKKTAIKEPPLIVREDPATAVTKANEIRKNTPAQVAEGLILTLWASDSLAPDPVAMSIDDAGNVYLTRTNRHNNTEFDLRAYRPHETPTIT